MKKFCALAIMLILAAVNPVVAGSSDKDKCAIVKATNTINLDRPGEIVAVDWKELQKCLHAPICDKIYVFDEQTSDTLISQIIDKDQNNIPEEIIFISDFKAKQSKQFILKASNRQSEITQSLTYICFNTPREDIAWENDRIAYRIYGPKLGWELNNGLDVWTKRVRNLIIDKWYKGDEAAGEQKISYHEDHGEGADLFNVGRTLGAGSCALYSDDSLRQSGVFEAYKILAKGPLRVMFEVTYKPVKIKGINISELKRFTLDAGSNLNRIEVIYKCDSLDYSVPFAIGLVKRNGVAEYCEKRNRWISLWGHTNEKEENGFLGTGVIISNGAFTRINKDSVHILLLGLARLGHSTTYYAGAGWTRSGDFNNVDEWNKYLNDFLLRLKSPLKIAIINK